MGSRRCQSGTPFWAVTAVATLSIASLLHHSSAKFQEGGEQKIQKIEKRKLQQCNMHLN